MLVRQTKCFVILCFSGSGHSPSRILRLGLAGLNILYSHIALADQASPRSCSSIAYLLFRHQIVPCKAPLQVQGVCPASDVSLENPPPGMTPCGGAAPKRSLTTLWQPDRVSMSRSSKDQPSQSCPCEAFQVCPLRLQRPLSLPLGLPHFRPCH
jgi:hypothetical protein